MAPAQSSSLARNSVSTQELALWRPHSHRVWREIPSLLKRYGPSLATGISPEEGVAVLQCHVEGYAGSTQRLREGYGEAAEGPRRGYVGSTQSLRSCCGSATQGPQRGYAGATGGLRRGCTGPTEGLCRTHAEAMELLRIRHAGPSQTLIENRVLAVPTPH